MHYSSLSRFTFRRSFIFIFRAKIRTTVKLKAINQKREIITIKKIKIILMTKVTRYRIEIPINIITRSSIRRNRQSATRTPLHLLLRNIPKIIIVRELIISKVNSGKHLTPFFCTYIYIYIYIYTVRTGAFIFPTFVTFRS